MRSIVEYFQKNSIIVFTSDIEWSPEWAIRDMCDMFEKNNMPLTPFMTHASETITHFYRGEKANQVGLHPNFLAGSSHGATVTDVVNHVCALWPQARSFRSHTFFDHYQVTEQFSRQGFLFDSNLCLFEQPFCAPLRHQSGLIRYPVYWEDDIHWNRKLPFRMSASGLDEGLKVAGLKVFNIHPLNVALNIPTQEYYQQHKFLLGNAGSEDDIEQYRFSGDGTRTFLQEVMDYVQSNNETCMYLGDVHAKFFC